MSPLQIIGGIKTNGPIQIPVLSEGAEFLTVEAFLGNFSAEQQPKVKECFKNERTFNTETPDEAGWSAATAAYNTIIASAPEGITAELMAQASKFVLLLFFVEEALGLKIEIAKEPKDQYANYVKAVEAAIAATAAQAVTPPPVQTEPPASPNLPVPTTSALPATDTSQLKAILANLIIQNKASISVNEHLNDAVQNISKALSANNVNTAAINAQLSQLIQMLDAAPSEIAA